MFNSSPAGILELASRGESETVEFKLRVPPEETLARILAAFANTSGGILIVGIDDKGAVVGVPREEYGYSLERLQKVAFSLLGSNAGVGVTDMDGKYVLYAIVHKAEPPDFPVATSRGEFFKRGGPRTVPVSAAELLPAVVSPPGAHRRRDVAAFVAMSFREEQEPALVDYYRAIERAVKATGLPITLRRIDLLEGDYEISQKLMDQIRDADIVIADFTLNPRNVYFELGFARGTGKRIIQTARRDTALEFDVRNWRTLFYRNATELEEKLAPNLTAAYAEIATPAAG